MVMNQKDPKSIVYLFGAGATHAELVNLAPNVSTDHNLLQQRSLLMEHVSKRVCNSAKEDGVFTDKRIHNLLSPAGLSNIELFISLIENNETKSDDIIEQLKKRIKRDITRRLTPSTRKKYYLHRSLLELHQTNQQSEKLIGLISLNYDQVLDEAYSTIISKEPNYCFSFEGSEGIPLLKLHGGFGLKYRGKELPIITPGVNKNYLELPYNFIWGRALELLIECDTLRVIGCSLSQNDLGLVDLLLKAHLKRQRPFLIQMITFDPERNNIKQTFGFFPRIETALEIDGGIISDISIRDHTKGTNPFKIWLRAKIESMMKVGEIQKTEYVKKVLE